MWTNLSCLIIIILLSLPCLYGHKGDHSQTEKGQSFWISPWTRAGEHQTWPAFDGVCYTPQPVVGLRSASSPLIVSSHCSRPQEAPVNTKKVSTYACSTVILVISKANQAPVLRHHMCVTQCNPLTLRTPLKWGNSFNLDSKPSLVASSPELGMGSGNEANL